MQQYIILKYYSNFKSKKNNQTNYNHRQVYNQQQQQSQQNESIFNFIPNPNELFGFNGATTHQRSYPPLNLFPINMMQQQQQMQMYQQQMSIQYSQMNYNSNQANYNQKDRQIKHKNDNIRQHKWQNEENKKKPWQNENPEDDKEQESTLWKCSTCNYYNLWKYRVCKSCQEVKYRVYDRMRQDVGADDYDYLFFIDFECNQTKQYKSEIIEFPIHVVDVREKRIVESYSSYVKPSCSITPFIRRLTQIDDSKVMYAPTLQQVLDEVQVFLEKYLQVGVNRCIVIYDCDSDSTFLSQEKLKKNLRIPIIFERYICLNSVFPTCLTTPPLRATSIAKMLSTLNMKFEGKKHCGIDDSKNQALVAIELLRRGYHFSRLMEAKLGEPSISIDKLEKEMRDQQYRLDYESNKDSLQQQKQDELPYQDDQQDQQEYQQEVSIQNIEQTLNTLDLKE